MTLQVWKMEVGSIEESETRLFLKRESALRWAYERIARRDWRQWYNQLGEEQVLQHMLEGDYEALMADWFGDKQEHDGDKNVEWGDNDIASAHLILLDVEED